MEQADIVQRAYAAIGKGILYKLGKGGMHPEDPLPTRDGTCDCSGFVLWACGLCRQRPDGVWMDTSWVVNDAQGKRLTFERIGWKQAEPGMLVVYGDRRGADGRMRQGHIGIVTLANEVNGPSAVVHCSSGNSAIFGDAIRETGPEKFATRGIIVRVKREDAPA